MHTQGSTLRPHPYRITYDTWNRTTRRRKRAMDVVQATSRFGALRTWWHVQRQWQPLIEVHAITLLHHPECLSRDLYHTGYLCGHH